MPKKPPEEDPEIEKREYIRRASDRPKKRAPRKIKKKKPKKKDFGRKTREKRQKSKESLKDPVQLRWYLKTLRYTRRQIVVYLYESLDKFHITPIITVEKAVEALGISAGAWRSATKRLYIDGLIEKKSFKGGSPGTVFWFEPRIKDGVVEYLIGGEGMAEGF